MKRQANALTAVLENWQDVENAIDIYANSAGSALRENEIYMDSWQAKSKALSASWNELVNTFLNADMFKGFIDGAKTVLDFLTDINGVLPILIGFLAGGLYNAIFSVIGVIRKFKAALAETGIVAALSTGGLSLLVGVVTTIIGGLVALGVSATDTAKKIENLIEKHDENIQKIDEEISKLESEKNELESIKTSLNDAIGDKQKLAEVQGQLNEVLGYTPNLLGDETDAIKDANVALEREIELKEESIRKEKEKRAEEEKRKKSSQRELYDEERLVREGILPNEKGWEFRAKLWNAGNSNDKYGYKVRKNEETGEIEYAYYNGNATGSTDWAELDGYAESLESRKQTAHEGWSYATEQYSGKLGQGFALQILDSLVEQGYGSGDITKKYEAILNSLATDIDPLIEKYYKTGSQEDYDALRSGLDKVGGMYWQHNQLGAFDTNLTEDALSLVAKGFEAGTEASKEYEDSLSSVSSVLKSLSEAAESLKPLQDAYKELTEDGSITNKTLSELYEEFKDVSGIDGYIQRLSSANLTTKEAQQILGELAIAKIEDKVLTGELKNATEDQIAQMLKEAGVANSVAVAHSLVQKRKLQNILSSDDFVNASGNVTDALADELEKLGLTETAITQLSSTYQLAQREMTLAASEGVLERLSLEKQELETIMSIADAYALMAGKKYYETPSGEKYTVEDLQNSYQYSNIQDEEFLSARGAWEKDKQRVANYAQLKQDISETINNIDNVKPKITSGSSKGSSKGDTPDKEDNTEAVINRINLRANEIKQQEKEIENAMELAEIEEDYGKQIGLSNDLLEKRKKRVEALNTANAGLHNEAEYLRNTHTFYNADGTESDENTWFDSQGNATEAYYALINKEKITAEEKEAIESLFESLSKYKKAYMDNAEEIREINKQIKEDEKDIIDYYESALEKGLDDLDRYTSRIIDEYEDEIESLEKRKTKEESLLSIKEKQYEITNDMADAQHEVDKEIEKSRRTLEYLDKDMADGIFNEDDYAKITAKIEEISADIADETERFENKINNLGEDEMYLAETITAEYERRVEMKKQELEIVKAEIDLQKKKDQLDNVLANRNTRVFRDGQWIWTYDIEKAQDAIDELSEAEYNLDKTKREKTQQTDINNRQAGIDNLTNEIGAYEANIEKVNKATEELKNAIDEIINPVLNIGAISDYFTNYGVAPIVEGFNDLLDSLSRLTGKTYKYINGYQYKKKTIADSFTKWKTNQHADGTRYTPGGLTELGEEGFEAYISSKGRLIPINQPTIGNIASGGVVFNTDQMKNLRTLWDMSNLNFANSHLPDFTHKTSTESNNIDNSIKIGNLEIDGNSQEGKELNNILRRIVATHSH